LLQWNAPEIQQIQPVPAVRLCPGSVLIQGANVEREAIEDTTVNKVQKRNTNIDKNNSSYYCASCGSTDHNRSECKFKDVLCYKCHKKGHIAKACRSKSNNNQYNVNTIVSATFSVARLDSPISLTLLIEQVEVKFELDTGSPVTIINSGTWDKLGKPNLQTVKDNYHSFTGHPIQFRGEIMVNINYNDENRQLKTLVGYNNQANIVGRDWIIALKLINEKLVDLGHNKRIFNVNQSMGKFQDIVKEYKEI